MKNSTLLQYIEKLNPGERRELHRWLASPFFNRRAGVLALYEHIDRHLAVQPEQLRKEAAFAALFPGERFDDRRLNHLMSWLLAQVRDFLCWQEGQSDEGAQGLLRCRALRRRGLDEAFEKEYELARQTLDRQPWRDEHWHHLQHQLFREKYEHASLQSRRVRSTADLPLADMAAHAEAANALNRLRYACSTEVLRAVSGERSGTPPAGSGTPPAIDLYENLLRALRDPADEPAFFQAKSLLEQHWQQFRDSERRDLYLLSLNFCIRKTNSGQRQFMREAFELYRSGLENRALFENGALSRFTYKNAATAGLALFEFGWVRQFLEDYKIHLPARERHGVYTYNLASYYFRLPDYEQAMQLLRDADFGDDAHTHLDARAMLLRIYFERGYQDALESLLDSFQTYLRRQKDIGYQRDNYLNLLRFVRKLLRLPPGDAPARLALRREVEATAAVAERGWVLEQCG
ncbi:MAG: hypothetical protein IT262_01615 [Saprospiraceae bacterium]|nr:hypothetical protein [Saprospiraceae bacterium]